MSGRQKDLRMTNITFLAGDRLYRLMPNVYVPLYSIYKRITDTEEIRLIEQHVNRGAQVVDIGANIGFYSRLLSDLVGPDGHVYSFEPEPRNYSMLAKRVAGRPNVTAVNGAIGKLSGVAKLYISPDLNVDHQTYDDGTERISMDIQTFALDDYFKDIGAIDFIKMDIQGHEYQALLGAREILAASAGPKLLLEFSPYGIAQAGDDPRQMLRFLEECGYTIEFIAVDKQWNIESAINDPSRYINIFARKLDS